MIGLLNGELIKLRTTRTAVGFALLALLLLLANVLIGGLATDPITLADKRQIVSLGGLGGTIPYLLVIFGVVGATGEHRHGTITAALLIAPDRIRVTLAKLLAYALTGALVAVLVGVIAFPVGLGLLSGSPGPDLSATDLVDLAIGGIVAFALASALGVAFGSLVRNQVAAVVASLAYLFIAEPLLSALTHTIEPYTVGSTLSALCGLDFGRQLQPVSAGLVLLGWTAVVSVLAVLADRARDVN
jgi:ABC-2 type transport system permease protein